MEKRIDELARENEELRQRTQVTVKKVETNVIEKRAGLDAEAAHRITELESRVSELEIYSSTKTREVEELTMTVTRLHELQSEFDVYKNRVPQLEQLLEEKILELEALRKRFSDLALMRDKDLEVIRMKDVEIAELLRKIKELEVLPGRLDAATKNIQVLTAEVDRLTLLARERDQEIAYLRKKMSELEASLCPNFKDHDELRTRIAMYEKLQNEMADLKNRYTALCSQYEKEITIVRSKDKEIDSLNKTLQTEIKESRKALDKELTREEKLEHEIENLRNKIHNMSIEIDEWRKKAAMVPELHKECKALENENLRYQDRIRKLEEVNHQLDAKIVALMKEIDALRDALKRSESSFISLQREKTVMVTEFEKSQQESSAILADLNNKKNAEIEALNMRLAKLNQEMLAYQKEVDILRNECNILNAEKIKIQKALEEHTIQERDLFARVDKLKRDRDLLAKEIADMVAEKDRLKALAVSKDKEVIALDKDIHAYAKENEHLHAIIADLEKKLLASNNLLRERDAEIAMLRTNLQNVTISQKELFDERARLAQQNTFLSSRIAELETSVTTISTKYSKLERIYNEIRGATAQIADVHDKLIETCEETEKIKQVK